MGFYIPYSFHSGRTDSNRGHRDLRNVSRLGFYHYHSGHPAHSYEDNVKNNIFSRLSKFIQDIKSEFDYYVSQVTDKRRREDLIIGIVAGIVQNILKSGLDTVEVLLVISDLAINLLSTENTPKIVTFFNNVESWLSQPIDNLENTVSFKDSYYLGKSLGDVLSIFIGLLGIKTAIATFLSSFGLGMGSALTAPGTTGASLAWIAVSVEGTLTGTSIASGSLVLAGNALASLGKDFSGFSNVRWKSFSNGKLKAHYDKHVVERKEFGDISQNEYLRLAKDFGAEASSSFQETQVGNFLIKYDPATRRTFVGHLKSREIRTFYIADILTENPFQEAIDLAKQLSNID